MDRKYTHFALDKKTNEIVNGWEYKGLDIESIKEYSKNDLKDNFPDRKLSEFKLVTKSFLLKNNIDPMDNINWFKITEDNNKTKSYLKFTNDYNKEKPIDPTNIDQYEVRPSNVKKYSDNKDYKMGQNNEPNFLDENFDKSYIFEEKLILNFKKLCGVDLIK